MLRSRSLARLARIAGAGLLACAACTPAPEGQAPPAPKPSGPVPPETILEHEPNDLQHAQAIPPRAIVLGQIAPGKKLAADDDWYRVEAGAGRLLALRIELAQAEPVASAAPQPVLGPLDAQLELDDRDRNRLMLAHATSSEPALLPAVACSESCFVHVWGANPAAYKLTVLGALPQEDQELEPNNRAIDATPLAAGKSAQGTLFAPDDEDWYRVTAQARPGQFLRVELSGVAGVRPELELRALSDGALLASFRAPAEGEGIFLRDLSLAPPALEPEPPLLRASAPDAGSVDAGTAASGLPDAGAASMNPTGTQERADEFPTKSKISNDPSAEGVGQVTDSGVDAGPAAQASAPGGNPAGAQPGAPAALAEQPAAPAMNPSAGPEHAAPATSADATNSSAAQTPAVAPPAPATNRSAARSSAAAPGAASTDARAAQSNAAPTTQAREAPSAAPLASSAAVPDAGMLLALTPLPPPAPRADALDAGVATQGYYLVVRSSPLTDEKKAPRGANPRAPYTLATALEAGPADLESEPNDDPQHATWMPAAVSAARTGFLAPAGDADWYRVRNEGKSVLRAEVSGLGRADVELAVFAAPAHPGEKPVLLAHANEGGVREGELLPAVGIEGDALVLVQCAARELDGAKVRDCEDRDSPYTLSVSLAADDGALEREPNDDVERAQPVALPARVLGTLWPKRDIDVFRLQLDAPRAVSFRLSAVRGVDTMLTLRELKTNKRGRATAEVIGTADASRGEGPEEILAVPLKPGAYAIEVSSPRRDGSPTQTYTLQIQ